MNKKTIPLAVIIAGALIAGAVLYLNYSKCSELTDGTSTQDQILSSQQAWEKTMNFISQNILEEETTVSLNEIFKENGMYRIKFTIEEQEVEAYLTLDGKFLFPKEAAIDLEPALAKEFIKTDIPEVKLFVMSFCSYGNQAEELMIPVVELLENKANIQLHYIISKSPEGEYTSLHGEQELNQDIREICVNKYQPDKFWQFVKKINENCDSQNVDSKWEQLAAEIGIDVQKIKDCQKEEGVDLLNKENTLSQTKYLVQNPAAHQGREEITISGSPTLVINDIIYDGGRSSEEYKNGICSAFKNPPGQCSQELGKTPGPEGVVCE